MAWIKSKEDITLLREAGRRLARVLDAVEANVARGVAPAELDAVAERLIRDDGDEPAFLNYTPEGARRPFPATLCVSVNEQVVHGIPTAHARALREGDIVGIDLGLIHRGLVVDAARTVPVGHVSKEAHTLIDVTKESLVRAIAAARGGAHIGDIGAAIEGYVRPLGYGIVRALGGHGVGHAVHEEPFIPNCGKAGRGEALQHGMVLAIEPMLTLGKPDVSLKPDGYTIVTRDRSLSAHFEHTILITENAPEILTQ